MPLLVVVGTLLVDEVLTLGRPPAPGTQQRALARRVTGGGQVWHTARAARATGVRVAVAGRRGSDADAVELVTGLSAAGVEDRLVATGPSRRATVLLLPDGDRAIVSVPDESPGPLPTAGAAAAVDGADRVHIDGYALDGVTGDLVLAIADRCAAAGVPVSLEPPSTAGLPHRRERLGLLPPLDVIAGRPDEVAATSAVLSAPPRAVVEHVGAAPVTWAQAGAVTAAVDVPAGPVDTLGAGDRFTGGLLAALLAGAEPLDALLAGVRAAHLPGSAP